MWKYNKMHWNKNEILIDYISQNPTGKKLEQTQGKEFKRK